MRKILLATGLLTLVVAVAGAGIAVHTYGCPFSGCCVEASDSFQGTPCCTPDCCYPASPCCDTGEPCCTPDSCPVSEAVAKPAKSACPACDAVPKD